MCRAVPVCHVKNIKFHNWLNLYFYCIRTFNNKFTMVGARKIVYSVLRRLTFELLLKGQSHENCL